MVDKTRFFNGGAEYTDGSTFSYTNCSFVNGGAYKQGKLVNINMRIQTTAAGDTSSPPLIQINGVPYVPKSGASAYFVAIPSWDDSMDKSVKGYMQGNSTLSQNGLRIRLNNSLIVNGDILNINFVYVCN